MKSLVVYAVSLLLLISFHFFAVSSHAQFNPLEFKDSVPGLNCGVPGADNGRDKCCKQPEFPLPDIGFLSSFEGLPLIGEKFIKPYNEQKAAFDKFQKEFVLDKCAYGTAEQNNGKCTCVNDEKSEEAVKKLSELCGTTFYTNNQNRAEEVACRQCTDSGGYYSGMGCIPLTVGGLVGYVFSWGIGIAGGVAFMCILFAAFQMQTSQGKAETVKKAQEMMTACITGLVLILFSILILRIVGKDILRIPFFSQ